MNWSTLRRGQLDALDRRTPVVMPLASTEQHGQHLPLGTDSIIGEAIAERLDAALGGRLLILPTQRVGCSEHHMKFPGSLTLTHETFRRWVIEVADSVVRHGFSRIVLLNSHGGNSSICDVLGQQLGEQHPDADFLVATWWTAAAARLKPLQQGPLGSVGHCGEFETSILQAIAPELVDMSLAKDDGIQHRQPSMHFDMLHPPAATCYRPFHVLSQDGVFGKPSLASPEKGQRILAEVVEALGELITGFWTDFAWDKSSD